MPLVIGLHANTSQEVSDTPTKDETLRYSMIAFLKGRICISCGSTV